MPRVSRAVSRKRRPRTAAAIVVVLVVGVIGYVLVRHGQQPVERVTGCDAGADADGLALTPDQAGIAATIAGVADRRAMPVRAVAIAYAAALQESKLTNLPYGDRDSVGIFQQRPSEGWGTAQQIQDPVYAAGQFFTALAAVPHYQSLPISQAAQAVQHSADGSAYDQYATIGSDLATAFTGASPHAVWCSYASTPGKPQLAAAKGALTSAFGPLPGRLQVSSSRSAKTARTTMAVTVSDQRQGWAVASWLVSHAAGYGVTSIRYAGYQWAGFTGSGHWTAPASPAASPPGSSAAARTAARTAARAATSAVEFG